MKKLKRLLVCGLCLCFISQTAFATRYMQTKQNNVDATTEATDEVDKKEDISAKLPFDDQQDWGNMYFNTELPGSNKELFEGYTFNGEQIDPPNYDLYDSFKAEQITNMSDAIVDYRGWDAVLGATAYNAEEKSIDFEVSSSSIASEKTFGYATRKFGCETYEFDFKIEAPEKWSTGFIAFSMLTTMTQAPNWQTGVGGYMVLFRGTNYEFQRYGSDGQSIVSTAETEIMTPGEWHRVKIDVVKDGDTKIITTTVDGKELFSYTDELGYEILDEGYFNLLCWDGTKLSLRAVEPTIAQSGGKGEASATEGAIVLKIGSSWAFADGKVIAIDENNANVAPYTESDRTLVPLRFISEQLGAVVSYDEENKKAILAFDECNMEFTEGFAEYKLDDDWFVSNCKTAVQYDRMFVPVRVIAESVGKTVDYLDGYVFISDGALTAEEKTELMDMLK